MELTYEEQLKLENSKEHLKVVLINIRTANEELVKVLKLKEDAEEELKHLRELNAYIQETNLLEAKKGISIKKFLSELTKQVESLSVSSQELEAKTQKKEHELENINVQILESASRYGKVIETKKTEIKTLESQVKEIESKKAGTEGEIAKQARIKKAKQEEVSRLNSEIQEAQKELVNLNKRFQDNLELVTKQIDEEVQKIKNPLELIKREQEKLETERKNLEIIKARLTKQFKAQNPEKLLPIELQKKNGR